MTRRRVCLVDSHQVQRANVTRHTGPARPGAASPAAVRRHRLTTLYFS